MLLHVRTRGGQHKAQEENGLVSGLQDYRYLSVTKYETRGWLWRGHQRVIGSPAAVSKSGRNADPTGPSHDVLATTTQYRGRSDRRKKLPPPGP